MSCSAREMFRSCAIVVATAAAMLVGATPASAANLFASPSGDAVGPNDCTNQAAPCSIERAVEVVATGTDDVTLLPGTYNVASTLMFPITESITVHGMPGARPQINVATGAGMDGVYVRGTLRDVTIVETGQSGRLVQAENANDLIERVFVHSTFDDSRPCTLTGVLRDSVCWAEGDNSVAAAINRGAGNTGTANLRNVTAISTGVGGVGIQAGSGGSGSSATLFATNVIADGAQYDIQTLESTSTTTVNIDFSNYVNTHTTLGGTINAGMNNETAAPVFRDAASGDFRQQPGSAGTVDQGTANMVNGVGLGASDLDGQNRTIGMNPDIGADELANTTSTGVVCSPASLVLGSGSSNCTATVTDTAASPTVPTGNAALSSTGAGAFAGGGTCTLAMLNATQSSCQVAYTPASAGAHQITASYLGDGTHDPSQGSTALDVSAPPLTPAPPAPGAVPGPSTAPPKKRCKRKRRAAATIDVAASRKRCKKKRK